jgi:hypothetical protein
MNLFELQNNEYSMMVGIFEFSTHHPHTHAFEPSILKKSKQMPHYLANNPTKLTNINI